MYVVKFSTCNLDKASACTFSPLGMCWMGTLSKLDCMILRTRR